MNFFNLTTVSTSLKSRAAAIALAVASGGIVSGLVAASFISVPANAAGLLRDVRTAIELRLPKTPVTSLNCKGFGGLCEVVSGKTLFYIDEQARYLFVGRLYDMENRADLTAAKLLELNPDLLVANATREQPSETRPGHRTPAKVPVSELPKEGAVHWGNKSGEKLIIFSDFACGYCKRLASELEKAGVHVEERPISIFGASSRKLAEKVLCADDPAAALHKAYAGGKLKSSKSCDTRGLDANEAFAKKHGFSGTPVIVRASDGAVIEGFREAAQLRAFANPKTKGAR